MKTITIISIVLFAIAASILGIGLVSGLSKRAPVADEDVPVQTSTTETPSEHVSSEEIDRGYITAIEIYLDGDRNSGIFLGQAQYPLESPQAASIYGDAYSAAGYSLTWENTTYAFEPGSAHYIYVYAYIPEYGWQYIREEVIIPGDPVGAENIFLYIDGPKDSETVSGQFQIMGWSADAMVAESPAISSIEVYLNGPRDFGRFLGNASLGLERPDVVEVLSNQDYLFSGYSFSFDAAELEAGSLNTFYIYSFSTSGQYKLEKIDLWAEGIKSDKAHIFLENNFADIITSEAVELKGWAIPRDIIEAPQASEVPKDYTIKKIIFTSSVNGNEDIYSMDLDGTGLQRLTDHEGNDMYPSVSSDGSKIAYTSDISGTWQLMLMDWDGSNKRQLTNDSHRSAYPSFSFDDRYIFYEAYVDDNWEIFKIDSGGSNQQRLTFNPASDDWHPSAHPYEYKVLFESGKPGSYDIFIMDSDGAAIERLVDIDMSKRIPVMSRDGAKIAFCGLTDGNYNIYSANSDGSGLMMLTSNLSNDLHPNFSPDGMFITYNSAVTGDAEIYIMNSDGSSQTRLTAIPGDDWGSVFLYKV